MDDKTLHRLASFPASLKLHRLDPTSDKRQRVPVQHISPEFDVCNAISHRSAHIESTGIKDCMFVF